VLDAAARYLAEIEPHSPTPYLIRRAAQLGQMSLPEMLAEVTADAGSLDKFFSLLGVRQAR
jgi:type VI secretion system protein ImpA